MYTLFIIHSKLHYINDHYHFIVQFLKKNPVDFFSSQPA